MNLFYRVSFLLSISILFFSFTYIGAEHMFTIYDLLIIAIFFVFSIIFQSIILFLFNKNYLRNYILSFFCTINITSLHLIFVEYVHLLPFYFEVLIFIICFFLLIFICKVLEDSILMSNLFIISPIVIVIITFILSSETFHSKKAENINLNKDNNYKKINFDNRPNIYFISFESMVPLSIAKKNFKESKFAYHDILQKNFYKFENAFTLAFPSRQSLNSMLAFDQNKYLVLKKSNKHLNFFTGIQESPLLKIFKQNNYDLTTFYDNLWFGRHKGKYIDNYYVNQSGGKFNTCSFDGGYGVHLKISFLGYCLLTENIKFKIISIIFQKKFKKTTTVEKIIEIMEKNIKKEKPQFLMAHNINPGHTFGDYDYNREEDVKNFIKFYKEKSKITKHDIKKLLKFIKEKDKNAILLIYSDHGPKLSQGLEFEDDKTFIILDSFAIYAGIYPKEKCQKYAKTFYKNQKFATLIDISKIIINCIKKNETTMNFNNKQFFMDTENTIKYFNNEENIILGYDNNNLRPENYLYE